MALPKRKRLPANHPFATKKAAATYTPPPPGWYDPTLDANLGGAQRGLFDLGQDIATQNQRDTVDYGLGVADVNRGADRQVADTQRGIDQLHHSYDTLAENQLQGANAAGVLGSGAALQAAQKRAANMATDQRPFDTALSRIGEDRTSALGHLAIDMAPPDASNPFGGRRFQDRATQLTRAARENVTFGIDTAAAKAYDAYGAGWSPQLTAPKVKKKKPAVR